MVYISDIGADFLQPLFIVACSITGVGFLLSLTIERWLRHSGRLHPHLRLRERICAGISIFGALVGAVALICLSVYDTAHHVILHRVFLLFFVLGVVVSALFTVVEVRQPI